MPNRPNTGPTSTFEISTQTLDDFKIKQPYAGVLTDTATLQQASDWNHMFDATIRLQKTISTGSSLTYDENGDPISTDASTVIYRDTLNYSGSAASESIKTVTGTIPSIFGTDPFLNSSFSICATVKENRSGASESCYESGLVNNYTTKDNFGFTPWVVNNNNYFTSVCPDATDRTGSAFTVSIAIIKSNPELNWVDAFYRGSGTIYNYSLPGYSPALVIYKMSTGYTEVINSVAGTSNWAIGCVNIYGGSIQFGTNTYLQNSLYMANLPADKKGAGYVTLTNIPGTTADQEIGFSLHAERLPSDGSLSSLCGFLLRASGTSTNMAGYALLFAGNSANSLVNRQTAQNVRIVKLSGHDMSADASSSGSGFLTDVGVTSLTGTDTVKVNNYGGNTYFYKFSAIGTTIKLEQSVNGAAFTTLLTVTDASISSGTGGFFVKPFLTGDNTDRIMCFNNFYFQEKVTGSIDFDVEVIMVKSGVDA